VATLALGLASSAARADDEGPPRPFDELYALKGKPLYIRECAGCHGELGNGQGSAAKFVDPKPRDFTKKRFKFKTTGSGEPPATADILRTIERGIPGSSMPSFSFLPEEERKQLGAYVLFLA